MNTRSSISGNSGSAQETQQEFLTLLESAIIENDMSKGIQRYQLAVQQAMARLDFAISPNCWLMPSNLVLNTGSVVGYNNKLQRTTEDMKFGVNDINDGKTGGIPHFGPTKKTVGVDKPKPPIIDKPKPTPKPDDHTFLKIGLLIAGMGLGYYISR